MRAKGGGHIFQISSQLGRVILPYSGHYSATKFALEAMSEQLAYELVPHVQSRIDRFLSPDKGDTFQVDTRTAQLMLFLLVHAQLLLLHLCHAVQ